MRPSSGRSVSSTATSTARSWTARPEEVVLRDRLRAFLPRQYPDLPSGPVDEALNRFSRPEGVDTLRRNMAFHEALTRGVELQIERPGGRVEHRHVYAIDWERPEQNEFLIVNQLPVRGRNDRRPDLVVFVNGLPLAMFELKNPWDRHPTVENALNQLAHYRHDISQLFEFNAVTVVSDGVRTLHGMWTPHRSGSRRGSPSMASRWSRAPRRA